MVHPGVARGRAVEQHSLTRSLVVHSAPAVVAFAAYLWVCLPLTAALGLPRRVAGVLVGAFVLTPLLLGPLLYSGWKRNGRLSLDGVVVYREKLPAHTLTLLVTVLLGWALLVVSWVSGAEQWLLENVFAGYPAQPDVETGGYAPAVLIAARVASLVIVGIVVPIVEELYFRGYLLPRVEWLGLWAIPWTAIIFTLYHLHSPWQSPSRLLMLLPMIYIVQQTRSISVGIGVHCIGNTTGEVQLLLEVIPPI